MKIVFILPGYPWKARGGFRVIYEYANALSVPGNDVYVLHANKLAEIKSPVKSLIKLAACIYFRFFKRNIRWMKIEKKVKLLYSCSRIDKYLLDADIAVATSYLTAGPLASADIKRGQKFYIVMDFAPWFADADTLISTWNLPFKKIAISKWISDEIKSLSNTQSTAIPLGIRHDIFSVKKAIEARPEKILMMYSKAGYKDVDTGIKALEICRRKKQDIKICIFGADNKRPADVPSWIEYCGDLKDTELAGLYNSASIFVSSSRAEGFAFPAAEAMACGCAAAVTDCGGNRDYAADNLNSLISDPGDHNALAENIMRLLEDDQLRIRIAKEGSRSISSFSWDRSAEALLEVFKAEDE